MLITLTCQTHHAPEIGYLLAKHPDSVFARDFAAGKVWVFYPEVTAERLTVALVTEIDPIALVRGPAHLNHLDQYVNDRPYVASSLTSVALQVGFGSALSGRTREHADRLTEAVAWDVAIPALACDGGEDLIQRLFAPLGYQVQVAHMPLDEQFPAWGAAEVFSVHLVGEQTVQNVLNHLYILLPVLDDSKHYYVDQEETAKLLAHGGAWLATHPERDLITRRYLRYQHTLVNAALAQLAENEATTTVIAAEENAIVPEEEAPGLHEQRLQAVLATALDCGAHSLVDLGCGEGRLLQLALGERSFHRIVGMDVSMMALNQARRRLRLESLPEAQQARIQLMQGSLLYRDQRLAGFDVATLVEVVEHLDLPRLGALEEVLFGQARPGRIIITTPNRAYNAKFGTLHGDHLRHKDHRFEWTWAECLAWAEHVAATRPYRFVHQPLGMADPAFGAPSQMLIFDRLNDTAGEAS
jgi:3' terminal RNA ribose 2'-O-methyltransferase Hen1